MDERRKSERTKTYKGGSIAAGVGTLTCIVRNVSSGGALLQVESWAGVPEHFRMVINPEGLQRTCQVVWRAPRKVGVCFVASRRAS